MTGVGDIFLNLHLRDTGFKKDMNSMHSFASSAVKKLAAAFTVKALADFGKKCIDLGSDLTEVQNVVDVAFPTMSKKIDDFANTAASKFGLSETMAKRYAGTLGSMAEAFGFSEKSAANMATTLTGLAGDVASFYNISQDEAYTKLKSVFTGETESLKELGVVMTQTALDQYALANGFGKTTSAMSEAEKVALRYKFVQDQLTNATGDFARTAGSSWANQIRILSLQFDSLRAAIGQILIKALLPLVKGINAVLSKLVNLAKSWSAFFGVDTSNVVDAAGDVSSGLSDVSSDIDTAGSKAADATKKATTATDKLKRSLMGFDKINKLDDKSSSSKSGGNKTSTGSGKAPEIGSLEAGGEVADKVNAKLTKMLENITKLAKPATESLKKLRDEGLAKLGNFSTDALKDFYSGFLVPVGKWAMGEGLPRFIDALNEGLMKVNYDKIRSGLKNLWDALAPFSVTVGEGLLWFWENVLVPLGTWTANEVVPRFLNTLANVFKLLNSVLKAIQPQFDWLWKNVLTPIAKWTGGAFLKIWDAINWVLKVFSDWCAKNPGTVRTITGIIVAFMAAWKATELMSFIQQTGGVVANLKKLGTALYGVTIKKLADKAETIALTAMYAGDFIVSVGKSIAALAKQAAQFAINTAAKAADATAQAAMTAATTIWSGVCTVATGVTTAFGAALSFLTSPIGIVIAAITAAVAIGVALYKNWDKISAFGKKVWSELGGFLKKTWEGLKTKASEVWGGIKETVTTVHDGIKSKASSAWQSIKSTCQTTWSNLRSSAGTTFDNICSKVANAWSSANSVSSSTWNSIKSSLSNTWTNLRTTAGTTFDGIKTKLSDVWSQTSNISEKSWKATSNIVEQGLSQIAAKASAAGKVVETGFVGVFRAMVGAIKAPVNAIIGLMNGLVRGAVSGINGVLGAFNKLHIEIPSWVPGIGGKRLGFNFRMLTAPQIPKLATGAYVKANTPQLAMIGDNRHQGEFVAPEDKLKAAVREATSSVDLSRVEALLKQIIQLLTLLLNADKDLYLDGDKLTKKVIQRINEIRVSTGLKPV